MFIFFMHIGEITENTLKPLTENTDSAIILLFVSMYLIDILQHNAYYVVKAYFFATACSDHYTLKLWRQVYFRKG